MSPDVSADALARIRARGPIGIRLGLDRMRALLTNLGDPQASLRGALIGGTNGKGSVCAMVASVLQAGGWHTSQSPSPHLSSYRERITIDGRPIGLPELDDLLEEVLRASEPGEAEHGPATEFELFIAAAFIWSARQHVDAAIIEVGLGGRLDATNTWAAPVAAITNVGLDHRDYLGDTIEAVAAEKAAIIKAGSLAVTGATGPALKVIEGRARAVGAPLTACLPLDVEAHGRTGLSVRHERLGQLRVGMLGRHQAHNAAVALAVLAALSRAGIAPVDDVAIVRGLADAHWPGRLELIEHEGLTVLLDGAHNPDGAAALAAAVDELAPSLPGGRATLVLGLLRDKDVAAVVTAFRASSTLGASRVITTSVPQSDRSLAPADLARAWRSVAPSRGSPHRALDEEALVVEDPKDALASGLRAAADEGGVLVVSGSLYLVGHLRGLLVPDAGDPPLAGEPPDAGGAPHAGGAPGAGSAAESSSRPDAALPTLPSAIQDSA